MSGLSGRLSYYEDSENYESLDKAKLVFEDLPHTKITLTGALKEAGIKNPETAAIDAIENWKRAKGKLDPSIVNSLMDDEAGAIACYTSSDIKDEKDPLYKVINSSIVGKRSRTGLQGTKKFIYLFLCGLRKLPKFKIPIDKKLYRGIDIRVPTSKTDADGHQWYEKDRTVTWWGFTSTSLDPAVTINFLKDPSKGTLFTISGGNSWGYDIQAFSDYSEDEILLEPEAKVKVTDVGNTKKGLEIVVELQPFGSLVLSDITNVPRKKFEVWEYSALEGLTAKQDVYGEVELSWTSIEADGVKYQIKDEDKGTFYSSTSYPYEGFEHSCVLKGLKEGSKHEFCVQCKLGEEKWGEWSSPVSITVEPLNVKLATGALIKYHDDPKVCSEMITRIIQLAYTRKI